MVSRPAWCRGQYGVAANMVSRRARVPTGPASAVGDEARNPVLAGKGVASLALASVGSRSAAPESAQRHVHGPPLRFDRGGSGHDVCEVEGEGADERLPVRIVPTPAIEDEGARTGRDDRLAGDERVVARL